MTLEDMKGPIEGFGSETALRLSGNMSIEEILKEFKNAFDKLPKNNYSFVIKNYKGNHDKNDFGYFVHEMCQDLSQKGADNFVNWDYIPYIEIKNRNSFLEEGLYQPLMDFKNMKITLQQISNLEVL